MEDNIVYTKDIGRAVAESYLPCLIEVWMPTSPLSRLTSGAVLNVAKEYKGKFTVIKYKAEDEYDPYVMENKLPGFPYFMVVKRDKLLKHFHGMMKVSDLREVLEECQKCL